MTLPFCSRCHCRGRNLQPAAWPRRPCAGEPGAVHPGAELPHRRVRTQRRTLANGYIDYLKYVNARADSTA